MRQFKNEVYNGTQIVSENSIDWTVDDYKIAIANEAQESEIFALKNELAFMLGKEAMSKRVDEVSDEKRMQFLGNATRAFEYQEAERGAREFEVNQFVGPVPHSVQSWSDATGMTAKEAAQDILQEAAKYNFALNHIRALRLAAKQRIAQSNQKEDCQQAYFEALQSIFMIGS